MNLETNQNPNQFNANNPEQFNENSGVTKLFMMGFFVILVAGAFFGGYKLSQRFGGSVVVENEILNTPNQEIVETTDNSKSASLLNAVSAGKGEVVFKVSSYESSVLREIFVYNPFKNSWIQVYDGYRELTSNPQEVIRVNLASMKYNKVRVRTLENYYGEIEKEIDVKENNSTEVNLEL